MSRPMPAPFLIAQLSDPHAGAEWGDTDPVACLEAAVAAVSALDVVPQATIVSGDLSENGRLSEYEQVREALERLPMPVFVLPGNHDERGAMRAAFGLPGPSEAPIRSVEDVGDARLVLLDTLRPGSDAGELGTERLSWLEDVLAEERDRTTLIAMHHPPFLTGSPPIDAFALAEDDRRALGAIIERHPQVRRIAGGHVHRTIFAEAGGCLAVSVPSTYMQGRLRFGPGEFPMIRSEAGIGLHLFEHGQVTTHIQPVR